jgi:hypothetical protein
MTRTEFDALRVGDKFYDPKEGQTVTVKRVMTSPGDKSVYAEGRDVFGFWYPGNCERLEKRRPRTRKEKTHEKANAYALWKL